MNHDQIKLPTRALRSRIAVPAPVYAAILFLSACGTTSSTNSPPPSNEPPRTDETGTVREALDFIEPCSASTCGEVPPSSKAARPACTSSANTCGWTDPAPGGSVSFRQCAETECGTKPDASVCPTGTSYKGSTCGSENDAACVWRSACTPPRSTTPCEDADGCGPMPLLGVICKDGSTGEQACMKQGAKCVWQPTCE